MRPTVGPQSGTNKKQHPQEASSHPDSGREATFTLPLIDMFPRLERAVARSIMFIRIRQKQYTVSDVLIFGPTTQALLL